MTSSTPGSTKLERLQSTPLTPAQLRALEEKENDAILDVESGGSTPVVPVHIANAVQAGEGGEADPFGNEGGHDIKFKTMTWWQTAMIMIAETISLGILSLPSALKTVGLVPGCILIIGLGIIATYTGYVLGQFKLRYPQVHTFAEAGFIIMGPFGRELFAAAQVIFLVLIMGSHILTFSIMLNVITTHGACTIVFTIIGLVVSTVCTFPRTMRSVSWLSIGSFLSVLGAVGITMIGVGIEGKRPTLLVAVEGEELWSAWSAVGNIVFAYAGHLAFFSFISEMKDPNEYPKALCALQVTDTLLYLTTALVIYRYTGDSVTSPALGSTTPLLEKIAYGVAVPTIVVAGVINGHVAAKYIYVRVFRGSRHLGSRSWFATGVWVGIVTALWFVAWVVASAVPVFNNLLGLIAALFVSWFTYGVSGYFWIHMNRGKLFSSKRKAFLTIANAGILCMGATIMVLGLYSSGMAMKEQRGGRPFTCDDNSVQ